MGITKLAWLSVIGGQLVQWAAAFGACPGLSNDRLRRAVELVQLAESGSSGQGRDQDPVGGNGIEVADPGSG